MSILPMRLRGWLERQARRNEGAARLIHAVAQAEVTIYEQRAEIRKLKHRLEDAELSIERLNNELGDYHLIHDGDVLISGTLTTIRDETLHDPRFSPEGGTEALRALYVMGLLADSVTAPGGSDGGTLSGRQCVVYVMRRGE